MWDERVPAQESGAPRRCRDQHTQELRPEVTRKQPQPRVPREAVEGMDDSHSWDGFNPLSCEFQRMKEVRCHPDYKVIWYFEKGGAANTFLTVTWGRVLVQSFTGGDRDDKMIWTKCLLATLHKNFESPRTSLQGKNQADGSHDQGNPGHY